MSVRTTLLFGSISAMLGVLLGAFGAHALHDRLLSTGRVETFDVAVEYQFYHALALLLTGIVMHDTPSQQLSIASAAFATGIVFFSGSLYVLSIFNLPWTGAVTPFGGVAFIVGWFFFTIHFTKKK
jgi:uncharacterized membrane protein YgdD (TMEM256/DUF423 family)